MSRFVELDLLFKSEEQDKYQALGVNVDSDKFEVSPMMINIDKIDVFHPYDYDGTTLIYTKGDAQFLVRHSYEELKTILLDVQ